MRKYLAILTAFILSFVALPVSAAEVTQGTVSILPIYDIDIEPQTDDIFQIQLKDTITGNMHKITINASESYLNGKKINLPKNTYIVEDIEYRGKNKEIEESGYGILSKFDVTTQEKEISLSIGDEELEYLYYDYRDIIGKKNGEFVNFSEMQIPESASNKKSIFTNIGTTSNDIDSSSPEISQEIIPTDQSQHSNELEKEFGIEDMFAFTKERNYLIASLPIIILTIVGFGVIFILHKKGKI